MTLLVIDDNRSVLAAVRLIAELKFDRVVTSTSPSRIPALLREEHPDCILLDMNFKTTVNNGNEGLYWLSEIRRLAPGVPVVLFTAYAEVDLAVEGLKSGAADFVMKPWDNARLLQTLLTAAKTSPNNSATNRRSNFGIHSTPKTIPSFSPTWPDSSGTDFTSQTSSNPPAPNPSGPSPDQNHSNTPHSSSHPFKTDTSQPSGANSSQLTPRTLGIDSIVPTTLEEMERLMITRALADAGGNLTLAASTLGITRQTLYNKIHRYNL